MKPSLFVLPAALVWALCAGACSSSDSDPNSPPVDGDTPSESEADAEPSLDGDVEATPDGDVESADDESLAPCTLAHTTRVTRFVAKALDENGQALAGAKAIFCLYTTGSIPSCLNPATADSNGVIVATVPSDKQCVESAAVRILSPPSGPARIIPSCPVDLKEGGVVSIGSPMKLIQIPAATRDAIGKDLDSVHAISAPDGSVLNVIPNKLWLIDYAYGDIAPLLWDTASQERPCFMKANDSAVGIVAIYPEVAAKSKGGAQLRIPNAGKLAQGTLLDVYGVGGVDTALFDKTGVEEGLMAKIGTAVVSADGKTIETQGDGLPFLTWVVFKLAATSR